VEDNNKTDLIEMGRLMRTGSVAESCDHSNEPSGFIKVREFLG